MKLGKQSGNATSALFIRVVHAHSKRCTPPSFRGGHWRVDLDEHESRAATPTKLRW